MEKEEKELKEREKKLCERCKGVGLLPRCGFAGLREPCR